MQIYQLIHLSRSSGTAGSMSIKRVSNLFLAGGRVVFCILKCTSPFSENPLPFSSLLSVTHCWAPDTELPVHAFLLGSPVFLGSIGLLDAPHAHRHTVLWASALTLRWDCLGCFIFSSGHMGRPTGFCWLVLWMTRDSVNWVISVPGRPSLGSVWRHNE